MAGYARLKTADIQSGQVVKSAPINAELNGIVTAFAFSGGHDHSGSDASTSGAFVPLIADVDGLNKVVTDTSNNRVGFFVEVSSAAVEQIRIQDGAILPVTDNDIDLGASGTEFKDLFIDGTAHIDTLDVDGDATVAGTLDVTGAMGLSGAISFADGSASAPSITNTGDTNCGLFFSAADTLAFTAGGTAQFTMADGVIAPVTDSDVDLGTSSLEFKDGYFDGTVHTDAINLNGTTITSTAAEINILDGVTATATELNIMDGDTSAVSTTVADADRVVFNDGGTMKQVAVTDLAAYFDDEITAMPNLTSVGTLTTLTVDNVIVNGTTIGHTDDTDLITLADGVATVAGELSVTTLDIGGTNVTSTAAELNILDGVTATATELNIMDGVTASTAELNTLDGVTAVVGELNALDLGSTAVGTAIASKAVVLDSDKDYTGIRNFTITGNLTVGGTQTVVDTVTMNAQNAVVFEGATADAHETTLTITDPTADRTIKLPNQSGTLPVLAADSDTAITSTPAELNLLDGVTATTAELNILDGVTSTAAELNILDGVTSTATELNILDGDTSASSVTLVDADRVVVNDNGTMKQVALSDFETYMESSIDTFNQDIQLLDTGTAASDFRKLTFKRTPTDSAMSNSDNLGEIAFEGLSGATAYIRGNAVDVSSGSEIGGLLFTVEKDGSMLQASNFFTGTSNAFNILKKDVDFIVSTDNVTNMLHVDGANDGVGIGTTGTSSAALTVAGTIDFDGLKGTGSVTVTNILDEDDFSSNSATALATQQSIKALVDSSANVSGLTATGAEINVVADGDTSVGTTAVAGGDGIPTNDSGTMRLTSVDTFDTYLAGTTKTLTNKTLTAPKFADGGFIADANGNELIMLQTASSAVNQLEITNSATGGAIVVGASGDDSNIDIDISPKGTGEVNIAAGNLNYGGTAVTSTGAELNILDGVTSTATELNLTDGSSGGTIVNSKAVIYGSSGEVNATTLQIAGTSITATAAELNYVDGVTSAIQTQLDAKATKGFATAMAIAL